MKTKVILTVLAVISTFGILPAQTTQPQSSKSTSKKTCYVDANKNNVCDKAENKTCNGQGKGLKDGSGQGKGQCLRDGSGRGNGAGKGKGNCNGKGPNFVDANNNGVCDKNEVTK